MTAAGDDATAITSAFIGRRCTAYFAGVGTGSHVDLVFEPRLALEQRVRNPHITELQGTTSAEYSVFILCAWRLDSHEQVICGAWDDNSEGGPMLRGLDRLVGRTLVAFGLTLPGFDAVLDFDGLLLRIFCDQVNEEDGDDNYILFAPDRILTVGTKSTLQVEPRAGGGAPLRKFPRGIR